MTMDNDALTTIQKTLMTARLFDGFWDRWVAHGIILEEIQNVKDSLISVESWVSSFSNLAEKHKTLARNYENLERKSEAEESYRLAALYLNLVQWIYPDRYEEKVDWYRKSMEFVLKADQLSNVPCKIEAVPIDGISCVGRVRTTNNAKGNVIIINPIDSTKEELYSYENHFIELGFNTISFDGPGQGETYIFNGLKATRSRWEQFLDKVIDFVANSFPGHSIHLFGTSSGAAWSIYGSANSKVNNIVVVSPPVGSTSSIPNYFGDRIHYFIETEGVHFVPVLDQQEQYKNILLFHGNSDVMVDDEQLHLFFESLTSPKKLIEYPEEGHCCNFKLNEIRELSSKWYLNGGIKNEI